MTDLTPVGFGLALPHWAKGFPAIREIFLSAWDDSPHLHIRLCCPPFDGCGSEPGWLCPGCCNPLLSDRGYTECLPLFGFTESVQRFRRLAVTAGSLLPSEFKPDPALYPHGCDSAANATHPLRAWCEFIFVSATSMFTFTISPQERQPRCRCPRA